MATQQPAKSEETRAKILEAALALFRKDGFESATMRDIAKAAGVATGGAYYYYASKEALVMDFYERTCEEMQPSLETAASAGGLEGRLRALIQVKIDHFSPNRAVLRALLRNGADPKHPLSPFSAETRAIRDVDLTWFRRILVDCGVRIPRDLEPELPQVLWFYQMGVIYFWVTDESEGQARTQRLLELSAKTVVTLLKASALPLMRPVRKTALDLIGLVKGED